MSNMYFANRPKDEIAKYALEKVEDYYTYLETSGRLYLYRSIYNMYYRARTTKGQLYVSGKTGEYLNMDTADFRNLIQHLKVLTTQARAAFTPIATNTDYKSESQARVARGILEYYMKEKKIGRLIDQASELAIMYGDSYVKLDWDVTAGETVMVEEEEVDGEMVTRSLKDGDLTGKSYGPIDVPIDVGTKTPRDQNWYITRDWVNKYEVSSQYPELKDDIEALSGDNTFNRKDRLYIFNQQADKDSDIIPLYTLYHKKTSALPEGRMTKFLSGSILLFDGDLPFDSVPVYRMVPSEEGESPFGYSVSFDILPICEALRKLYSTLITSESVSGIPIILMPEGGNMDLTTLADGIQGMTYNAANGKPETMHLGQASPQTYEMIGLLKDLSQVISSINAVARGETPASLESGSSLALVLSTAIQFNSGLQRSYAELSEDIGTGMINIFKTYAKTKRMIAIAGITNKVSMSEWSSTDIDGISRVTVELSNPIAQTAGGRLKMAEDLLNKGLVTTVKQYTEVMMSGRLDPMVEDEEAENLYIRQENEQLSIGGQVIAIVTDEHLEHIKRHKAVLFSKEAKEDQAIVEATLSHIQEHIDILSDPQYMMLLASLGQNSMAMPPMEDAVVEDVVQEGDGPSDTMVAQTGLPDLPQMPINPMTGERVTNGNF